ncbi:entericidin A/B family lipoprotein [Ovoidimarina sediminis]|nr:entericidin A/B family lipoprotein [Rhodophyticola sp. MJ-SS7]MDU8944640.1 entericidin A/B family lipoprotein [Rhodophyticola sp. MJ-SS7]
MTIRILALVAALGLSACATVEGIGKDVESGGEAIQDASNEVEREL